MTKLPSELLHKFFTGEHAMRRCNGLWNSIWSGMMIETTVMRYSHSPADKIGITLNESALERWISILHVSSVQSLLGVKGNEANNNITHHKLKSKTRMKIDSIDRNKLKKISCPIYSPFLCRWSPARNSLNTCRKALNQRNKCGLVQNCRIKVIAAVF